MSAVQLISVHIGRVTGSGLAGNMAKVLPRSALLGLVALLFIANTINIGADLAAMGDAAERASGASAHLSTVGFVQFSLIL
jgi:Mn2+/Fe2+ NRAMP family transporter